MARAALEEDWPRTVAEFEAWHARQPERWEFVDGRPRLMAPASMTHSILKAQLFCARWTARSADSGCEVLIDGAADPYRRDLRHSRCGGDLCADRPFDPGRRRADDHRRGHVAVERGG